MYINTQLELQVSFLRMLAIILYFVLCTNESICIEEYHNIMY